MGATEINNDILNSWLWEEKFFTKGQAFIDILLNCSNESEQIVFKNQLVNTLPGELHTSEKILADRWGWSRTKTRTFLELLEKDQRIILNRSKTKTIIKLIKKDKKQDLDINELLDESQQSDQCKRSNNEQQKRQVKIQSQPHIISTIQPTGVQEKKQVKKQVPCIEKDKLKYTKVKQDNSQNLTLGL
jgi:hypothetical protein